MMRVVMLTTDSREHFGDYDNPEPYFGTAPQALLEGLAGMTEIELHLVCCVQKPVASPEKLAPNIWYHCHVVPKGGWLRTGYQGCIRAVRRSVAVLRPDLVHAQGTERDCALGGVFAGVPAVLTIHGNMRRVAELLQARRFSYHWWMARLEQFVVPRYDGVICITTHARQLVGAQARRTWLVPNAVDPTFFKITRAPEAVPRVVCVGTVSGLKNQNALIQALDPLAAQHRFALWFYGMASRDDAYGREFFRLVEQRPWCRHGGFIGRDQLKACLASASLLVLPSLEENCPMVVLEAMAAGVPVAASRIGGVPDLIEHGQNGLLFDAGDVARLCAAVAECLADPSAREQRAGRARARARQQYHPEIIARRHLEIYRDVVRSRS